MLLIIDNYDSFTYNLVQYFGELGAEMKIIRNDVFDLYSTDTTGINYLGNHKTRII